MNIGVIPFLLICLCLKVTLANRTSFYTQEVYCLSELPMSELIQIKSSLADEEGKLFRKLRNTFNLRR